MKIAPFLLCAQISCALVAALDGILSEGVKVSELFDRSQLAAENGYQVGHGQKGLPKRLWRREDQESQLEKRSVETQHDDALTEGTKDKWTSFSEGLNTRERWVEVEKRSGGVFKRSDPQADSVTIGGYKVEEADLLALIVGEKYKTQCKELEEYCKKIKGRSTKIPDEIHPLVKGICEEKEVKNKCNKLEASVTKKCTSLKDALTQLEPKFQDLSKLTDKNCTDNEPACFFLEGADLTQLKDKCNGLRNACYQMKREDVAVEVLLRAMRGDLKQANYNNCENKLKEVCYELSQESDELMQKCLDPGKTCKTLQTEAPSKCVVLKREVEGALEDKNKDNLKGQCHSLLEQCYFYGPNCKDETKCDKLKEECEKKKVTYTPPGHPFSPIEYPASLLERIGLEELRKRSALSGVFIGRSRIEPEYVMSFLTESGRMQPGCEKQLEKNCDYLSHLLGLDNLCKEDKQQKQKNWCKNEFNDKLTGKSNELKKRLYGKGVSNKENPTDPSDIKGWHELSTITLTERDCAELESQCTYLVKHYEKNLKNACLNLKAACYKRALYDVAYVALEKRLRGELVYTNYIGHQAQGDPEKQKKLLEHCKELRNQSVELFKMCMNPDAALDSLREDIFQKADILKPILDMRRDFPDEKDCVELQEKCEHLKEDSYLLPEACHTLKTRCQFRELSEDLKLRLLDEREDMLKNETECREKLKTKCHHWNRKGENPFDFPCGLRNDSCKLMTQRVVDHCNAFEGNLKIKKIADDAKNPLKQEEICLQWKPYCDTLLSNCNTTNDKIEKDCKKLKEECKDFLKRWELEEELMKELQGKLNDKDCKKTFDGLCTPVKNVTDPKSSNLSSLCKEGKNDDKVREDLCKKLVKRIQKRCPVLVEKLEKAKDEVKKKAEEYEKQREKVQKATTDAKLNVTEQLKKEAGKANLVRRDPKSSDAAAPASGSSKTSVKVEVKSTPMTKKHAEAIDLLSRTLDFYFELKGECDALTLDCGFQKDCDCESSCSSILATCSKLLPLTIAQPRIIEGECKTETEKESKGPSEGKKEGEKPSKPGESKPLPGGAGEGKNCTSIKTSDTWVTSTSTHTTTITSTSTKTLKVTLTSTRKCKPTKCTTGKGEPTSKSEEEEVVPSGGKRWLPSVGIAIVGVVVAIM